MADTASEPRIRIREATPADLDAIVNVHFAAFDASVMNQLMYPGSVTADAKAKFGRGIFPQPPAEGDAEASPRKSQTIVHVAECIPGDGPIDGPPEVVGFAKWMLQRDPLPEEEWKKDDFPATTESWGEGCDVAVVDAFIGGMTRIQRQDAKGEAALYLGILACSPTRQRLGVGAALVKWGVDLADSLGLPSRLEASPVGYRLYQKFGYEDVAVLDLDVTGRWGVSNTDGSNWGGDNAVAVAGPAPEGVFRTVIMRRPPKTAAA